MPTLIPAPSSTHNKERKRDPEMHQTRKENQCYYLYAEGFAYGVKGHAGVYKDSGLIHSIIITHANVHNVSPTAGLLHDDGKLIYGDVCKQSKAKRSEMARHSAEFRVAMRAGKRRVLPDIADAKLQDLI
jgi:IS5 family transposase